MRVPGDSSRTRRMHSEKWPAPPSRKSSRSTDVIDHVIQLKRGNRLCQVFRFVDVERIGAAVADIAEWATAVHLFAHDHERSPCPCRSIRRCSGSLLLRTRSPGYLRAGCFDLVKAGRSDAPLRVSSSGFFSRSAGMIFDRDAGGLAGAFLFFVRVVGRRGEWVVSDVMV